MARAFVLQPGEGRAIDLGGFRMSVKATEEATDGAFTLLGRQAELIRDRQEEHRVLEWCAMAGAADGSTGRAAPSVDGTPPEVSASVQHLMRSVVEICSSEPYERPF